MATSMRQMKKEKAKQATKPPQGAGVLSKQAQGQEIDPKTKQQIDVYSTMLTKFIHGKQTQDKVLKMLKAGDPIQAVPAAAVAINEQAEQSMKGPVAKDVVLGASVTLVSDLIEIGMAAGLFEQPSDEDISFIYQDTIQIYIEKGLKDGTIDPVELQRDIEPLMSEEQKALGKDIGRRTGLGDEPDERAIIEQYADKRVASAKPKHEQGVLSGLSSTGPQQGQPRPQQGGM